MSPISQTGRIPDNWVRFALTKTNICPPYMSANLRFSMGSQSPILRESGTSHIHKLSHIIQGAKLQFTFIKQDFPLANFGVSPNPNTHIWQMSIHIHKFHKIFHLLNFRILFLQIGFIHETTACTPVYWKTERVVLCVKPCNPL